MAYATRNDLVPGRMTEVELQQLSNDAGNDAVDEVLVTQMLVEASALVDTYCRQRYTVPLQVSAQVKSMTISIALYKLFLRRRRMSDDVRREYEDAIQMLRDIASGKAGLDQPVGATPQSGGGGVKVTEVEEKFSDDNIAGFV